jgi:hypothetical protein
MKADQYLKERLENQITWYDLQSAINKRWYDRLQISQLVLAALITLSVAFDFNNLNSSARIIVPLMGRNYGNRGSDG